MISSKENPHYKKLLHLHRKKERDQSHLFLVEGEKELSQAPQIEAVYYTEKTPFVENQQQNKTPCFQLEENLFAKISFRDKGVIGIVSKDTINQTLTKKDFLLCLEGIEKPGNLGAILRTASSVGIDGVILVDSQVDLTNPNVVRASLGAIFTVPIVSMQKEKFFSFIQKNQIQATLATPQAKNVYTSVDYTKPTCLIIGSENQGVSEEFFSQGFVTVHIPMQGPIDSLNASLSAGILLYEVHRQRNTLSR